MKTDLVPDKGRIPVPAYRGYKPYIFLSCAHKDAALVFAEILRLNELGYHVWYDEGISPENEREIANALKGCSLFLVMITPAAAASENVQNEINQALREKKPFLAVHLQETELKGGVRLQIGTKQAILKYKMSDGEYVSKIVSTFDRMGLPSLSGDHKAAAHAQSPGDIKPQSQTAVSHPSLVQPDRSKTLMAAAAVLILIAAVSIPLLNRKGKEQTAAAQGSAGSITAAVNENGEAVLDGVEYRIYEDHAVVLDYDPELETLEIPSRINDVPVTEISSQFDRLQTQNQAKLKSVTLPDTLESLGPYAFFGCWELKTVVFNPSLKEIGDHAFVGCAELRDLTLPDTLETIGKFAFSGCGSLKTVSFPGSVKSIGTGAFKDCSHLSDVWFDDTKAAWESIYVENDNDALSGAHIHFGK